MTKGQVGRDTSLVLQLSFKRNGGPHPPQSTLADLREGQEAVLERVDLPADVARRLMELGFLPGQKIAAARCAPGGDPRVFRVDGAEIALRRETAKRLFIRLGA